MESGDNERRPVELLQPLVEKGHSQLETVGSGALDGGVNRLVTDRDAVTSAACERYPVDATLRLELFENRVVVSGYSRVEFEEAFDKLLGFLRRDLYAEIVKRVTREPCGAKTVE